MWKALIELDETQLRKSAEALGAGKYFQFFPLMFTFQRWGGNSRLGQQMSAEDLAKLKARARARTERAGRARVGPALMPSRSLAAA